MLLKHGQHFKDIHPISHWIWMHKFRVLLFMLVGMLSCYPYLIQEGHVGKTLFEIMFTGLIFVSMYVLCDTPKDTVKALVFGVPALVVHAAYYLVPDLFGYSMLMGFLVIFYVYMTMSVLRHVLGEKSVDTDTISGAICIYLLMGMIWAMLYSLVDQLVPGSFSVANYFSAAESSGVELSLANESATAHFTVFLYFSYTTLTTLGYGDIIPASNAARSLTSLEAIAGVLYVGAFVARLISVYARDKKL